MVIILGAINQKKWRTFVATCSPLSYLSQSNQNAPTKWWNNKSSTSASSGSSFCLKVSFFLFLFLFLVALVARRWWWCCWSWLCWCAGCNTGGGRGCGWGDVNSMTAWESFWRLNRSIPLPWSQRDSVTGNGESEMNILLLWRLLLLSHKSIGAVSTLCRRCSAFAGAVRPLPAQLARYPALNLQLDQ